MPLGINDKDRIEKDRIGSDRRSFFRMVKGSDRIADPFLTKGSGSDRRSRKKGSSNSLTKCKQTADGSMGIIIWYN